ncbi:BREX system ATP-binding domain-containing protein, partial [Nannocystis pusilla]|uniref:BREX system ATP-binding domain-containing protein n=1 Tax=Nannocystis pusilla TaxID=889268 RepID=UPI003BF2A8F1
VRDLYPARNPERIAARVSDLTLQKLARGITGKLGGKVGVAPRVFLRKLVLDLLDKVDAHPDYDPAEHFELVVSAGELTPEERAAAGLPPPSLDDIPLEMS